MKALAYLSILLGATAALHAQEPPSKAPPKPPAKPEPAAPPTAAPEAKAEIDPKLDCKFFHTLRTSPPDMIIEHEDGHLEDTPGDGITEEDLVLIEQTADCVTNSQGGHTKRFSSAQMIGKEVEFSIYDGGELAGFLKVRLRPDLTFTCSYEATYVGPVGPYDYRFKKQALRLKSDKPRAGARLYAWISVEVDEIDRESGKIFPIRIEGHLKPVIKGPIVIEEE